MSIIGLLAGCVGTMDSLQEVKGEAPIAGGCEVEVTAAGTADVLARRMVKGAFVVGYMITGPSPSEVDITGYCEGVKRKELRGVAPRRAGTIEFGSLAP
jgi:hypothetical protein